MDFTVADFEAFARTHLLPLGLKLLVALAIFIVGRQLAKVILRTIDRMMERSDFDVSLRKFLGDVAYAVMLVAVVIAALDALGVQTTAVVAVLGAAGLAIGLALQGSLSNFAAGVMLIVLRPYKVGDLVAIGKYIGRVEVIRVFQTILITLDHRQVTIPNGQIIAQPIENLTTLGRRRLELIVSVGQATDLGEVRRLLESVLAADARIEQSPPATIDIAEITDTGVKLHMRPWTSVENYMKVASDTMEGVKSAMETAKLKYSVSLQAAP
jgi:small conductance mechanosensitive channel